MPLVEVPIQINLSEQQRQVLEVLHLQLVAFKLVALSSDTLPVTDDVQVVATQIGFRDTVNLEQVAPELVEEQRLAILVDAFVLVLAQANLQGP
ncbi:hypothetical protein D3C76_1065050 [compost metagenome]